MAKTTAPCSTDECTSIAVVKGQCKRCYMAKYNRDYYAKNRVDILDHAKRFRVSK